MARKGWEQLSESYRGRLSRAGIGRSAYESGATLHRARGHTSQTREAFTRRVNRFVDSHGTRDEPELMRDRIRTLGPQRGQAYMDYRRQMTRLYEKGHYREAEKLYAKRDKSLPDSMWWYHGIFGG